MPAGEVHTRIASWNRVTSPSWVLALHSAKNKKENFLEMRANMFYTSKVLCHFRCSQKRVNDLEQDAFTSRMKQEDNERHALERYFLYGSLCSQNYRYREEIDKLIHSKGEEIEILHKQFERQAEDLAHSVERTKEDAEKNAKLREERLERDCKALKVEVEKVELPLCN